MKLSERLKGFRADRPDEWTMDEFIREAAILESAFLALTKRSDWSMHVTEGEESVIDRLINEIETS